MTNNLETDLRQIALSSELKALENEAFRDYLTDYPHDLDQVVQDLSYTIESRIDCTSCGNCCRSLMINVTQDEAEDLARRMDQPIEAIKARFLEESLGGQLIINTIPCHFLSDNKCTIYSDRFSDCRAFPNLDQPGFRSRIFATLMHYGRCPIIYNVMEELKHLTNFTGTINA